MGVLFGSGRCSEAGRLFRSGLGVGVLRVALVRDRALFGGRR